MGTWGDVHTCTHGLFPKCSSDYGGTGTFGNLLETFNSYRPVPVPIFPGAAHFSSPMGGGVP